jgi:hypothetical protein
MDPDDTYHCPGGDDAVDRAFEHIEEAEHDLAKAHTAEERAEEELREAVEELKEARDADVEIIVNGQQKTVKEHVLGFEQVVKLAFPHSVPEQNVTFAVTFSRAASTPHAGELAAGGHVHVKKGTRFNVTRTVQS